MVVVTLAKHQMICVGANQHMNSSKTASKINIASPLCHSCYPVMVSHGSNWWQDSPGCCTNLGSSSIPPCCGHKDTAVPIPWLPLDFVHWQDCFQLQSGKGASHGFVRKNQIMCTITEISQERNFSLHHSPYIPSIWTNKSSWFSRMHQIINFISQLLFYQNKYILFWYSGGCLNKEVTVGNCPCGPNADVNQQEQQS